MVVIQTVYDDFTILAVKKVPEKKLDVVIIIMAGMAVIFTWLATS